MRILTHFPQPTIPMPHIHVPSRTSVRLARPRSTPMDQSKSPASKSPQARSPQARSRMASPDCTDAEGVSVCVCECVCNYRMSCMHASKQITRELSHSHSHPLSLSVFHTHTHTHTYILSFQEIATLKQQLADAQTATRTSEVSHRQTLQDLELLTLRHAKKGA
jgi:hypothetical protein